MFRQQFLTLGGGGLNLTAGDAMLVVSVGLPLRGRLREHAQPDEAESGKLWDEVEGAHRAAGRGLAGAEAGPRRTAGRQS